MQFKDRFDQFHALLNDPAQHERKTAAQDAMRKLVMAEPLPVLAVNLIESLKHHLDVLENYVKRRYDIDWIGSKRPAPFTTWSRHLC